MTSGEALADLVLPGAGALAHGHRRLVEAGTPAPAAAMYLAGWFAGGLAATVGQGLALAGAGVVVDADEVRWDVHADGWPEDVRLGKPAAVLVVEGHPWAGRPAVTVLDEVEPLLERTVASLVTATEPIVETCHDLAPVGRAGLWNEVGDGLGTALADESRVPVTPAMVAVLAAAVRTPGARWKARPSLRFAASGLGLLHVVQKGGCCLAYTAGQDYCSTCSFRDPEDCDARQVRARS